MALFKLQNPEDVPNPEKYAGAKIAIPEDNNGLVNVVLDYSWTISPKTARRDVPYMTMVERKLVNDVMLQQLIYNITALPEFVDAGLAASEVLDKRLKEMISSTKSGEAASVNENADVKLEGEVSNPSDPLNPYQGLYDLEDTGWAYVFPYFETMNHSMSNDWGKPAQGGAIGGFLGDVTDILSNASTDVNRIQTALGKMSGTQGKLAATGTYIERAKQYVYNPDGATYSSEFMLYNTTTIEDVIKNWELCFLLIYNMLPNRKTKTVFDPPPLYEIEIPGVRKSPAAFIAGLSIEFVGATRIMLLDVAGTEALQTIVPDAYKVRIDFQDVFPESKNFMNAVIDSTKEINVSSKKSQSPVYDVTTIQLGETVSDKLKDASKTQSGPFNQLTRLSPKSSKTTTTT